MSKLIFSNQADFLFEYASPMWWQLVNTTWRSKIVWSLPDEGALKYSLRMPGPTPTKKETKEQHLMKHLRISNTWKKNQTCLGTCSFFSFKILLVCCRASVDLSEKVNEQTKMWTAREQLHHLAMKIYTELSVNQILLCISKSRHEIGHVVSDIKSQYFLSKTEERLDLFPTVMDYIPQ